MEVETDLDPDLGQLPLIRRVSSEPSKGRDDEDVELPRIQSATSSVLSGQRKQRGGGQRRKDERRTVTRADAGLPGRAKKTLSRLAVPPGDDDDDEEDGQGTVAKVVGFPGAIATRPKWILALKVCSRRG
jgi:hypothetical protein